MLGPSNIPTMHDTRFNRRSNYDTEQVRAIARTKLDIGGEWTPVGAAAYDVECKG